MHLQTLLSIKGNTPKMNKKLIRYAEATNIHYFNISTFSC